MQHVDLSASPFWRSELIPVLVELDSKWAAFEEEYILELIQIERKARRYVMDVIFLENQLLYLDGAVASLVSQGNANQTAHLHVWQQWQSCRRQYVKKVFRLNAVANYRRKGHANLDLSVLEASENIIKTSGGFAPQDCTVHNGVSSGPWGPTTSSRCNVLVAGTLGDGVVCVCTCRVRAWTYLLSS